MTKEDLFLAIGEVEESCLLRSEWIMQVPSDVSRKEEPEMKKTRVSVGRIIRNVLIAAVIVSMLGVTAYAVGGYIIFDSPQEMIAAIFGDKTGYDHKGVTTVTDPYYPDVSWTEPAFERVPADESVAAEDITPHVSAVGQSIIWQGYTLTIDALMYDNTTGCGILTYYLENPNGIKPYEVQYDGEVYFPGGEIVDMNQFGNAYIIQEKTTDTCLAVAHYFKYGATRKDNMEITFYQWAAVDAGQAYQQYTMDVLQRIRQEYTQEEAIEAYIREHGQESYDKLSAEHTQEQMADFGYGVLWAAALEAEFACNEKITVELDKESNLNHISLGDGSVVITPISFRIDIENLEFLHTNSRGEPFIHADNVDSVVVCYKDGTEYVVSSDGVENTVFGLVEYPEDNIQEEIFVSAEESFDGEAYLDVTNSRDCTILTLMFNRIIDVDNVKAVIVNGVELTVD